MRLAASLTLPDELERARSAGSLVVFAGAGVSMGPPANLPNFTELAREIADPPVPLKPEDVSSLDRYLGRAERLAHVKVQERARAKLLARGGSHTRLHECLVGLFSAPDAIRLVTTNFDTHFTTAALSVFGDTPVRHAIGPALPLGRDFHGIAQLHGSLKNDGDRLVLTMSDFAEAYMTEGWATRFLTGLFRDRTVLFIGYSLNDPPMQYLLSTLPPTGTWYAVCRQDDQQRWIDQSIKTVTFAQRADGDPYGDLYDGMERWFGYARATPTDHDTRLREIIERGPPSSPEESDYLLTRLETDAGRVTFWTAAKDPAWLTWANEARFLDQIFDPVSTDAKVGQWSWWCVENYCSGPTPPFLSLVRRKSLRLHPSFALTLAHSLFRAASLPSPEVLRQLIAVIISRGAGSDLDVIEWLLGKLVENGYQTEAVAMLRHSTALSLERIEFLDFFADDTGGAELAPLANRVALAVDADDLDRFLDHHGKAIGAVEAAALVRLGQQRLIEAYELIGLARGSTSTFDVLSYGRTAIAPSNQDAHPHAEDVLVAIARMGLEAWNEAGSEKVLRFVDEHADDERRLLKRLALYAFTDAALPADEVLDRAIQHRWAQDFWVRPELYRLLRVRWPQATEDARARFIQSLRDPATQAKPDEEEHDAHARFSLSILLAELAPESPSSGAFRDDETAAHSEWKRQDADGYLSRVEVGWGGGDDIPSPISSDELAHLAADKAVERLRDEWDREDSPRQSLAAALQQACRDDVTWAAAFLATALKDKAVPHLIDTVLWGLRDAQVSAAVKGDVLDAALTHGWPSEALNGLSMLIEHWTRGLSKQDPDTRLLDLLDKAADDVFTQSSTTASGLPDGSWHDMAFNHPAGRAARVWWVTSDIRDRDGDSFVVSVEPDERARWERVLLDETAAGAHARPILGSASDRLALGDFAWASENLFPAFDPEKDPERAAQLWDGRIAHRHWSWTTVAGLRPVLRSFLANSATLLPTRADDLGDWVAFLVGNRKESGFSLADLQHFVQHGAERSRVAFARSMPRHVAHLDEAGRTELWQDVLGPYWKDRRTNVPTALSSAEVAEMIEWVLALPEVAHLAAAELKQTSAQSLPHLDGLIWKWGKDQGWMEAHPDEAATILRWLSESKSIPVWVGDDAVKHLSFLADHGASKAEILASAEALAAQSVASAPALVTRLRGEKS